MTDDGAGDRLQVRVFFGEHTIAEYAGDGAGALRYAEAMRRRFPSLRVSTEPLPRKLVQR
ncbi:hypothetical protein ACFV9C_23760 [Kribbella sp. NPDC059898]|uniref:hypothetical protein n=1 Tax=Kribbella sp. NPDC059898 TaxID=3346995 RepID=UPI00365C16EA